MKIVRKKTTAMPTLAALAIVAVIVVVTAVLLGLPHTIVSTLFGSHVSRVLDESPVMQQLAKSDPGEYSRIRERAEMATRYHYSPGAIRWFVVTEVYRLTQEYLPSASDEAVLGYLRFMIEKADVIKRSDPWTAYAILYKDAAKGEAGKYVDEAMLTREERVMADVIRTGAGHGLQYHDYIHASKQLKAIADAMVKEHGRDGALPFTGGVYIVGKDREAVVPDDLHIPCDMMDEFAKRVLALPAGEAADVVRVFLKKV